MSLRVNKDNIFFILPESRYSVSSRIDKFMDEDFTLYIKFKLFPETMETEKSGYAIARNGMHSGISATKAESGLIIVSYTYWFTKTNENDTTENVVKQVNIALSDNEINEFNEYSMHCDNFVERKIDCYKNGELVGTMHFEQDEKVSYVQAFYWFGCGSMIGPEEHYYLGEFEYEKCYVLNKNISIETVIDFNKNYKEKYSHIVFNDLRKLNYDYPLRQNFAFLCDFNHHNRYKVWDMSFNGNNPQVYLEGNIYF